jgi:DNA repair protein RadD
MPGPIPRDYQDKAIDAGYDFFAEKKHYNAFQVVPTGAGKSIIAANIIGRINEPMGILQPSKEILQQNFSKYISYGYRAGIYSASAGMKFIDDVTFCTIGSVVNKPHLFKKHRKWIIDECHLVNAEEGMYKDFMVALDHPKVLGLTASPYRLEQTGYGTSMLKFLNRTNPRFFNKVNYYIQNMPLFEAGHLADLEYWDFTVIDRKQLILNSSGSDYTTESLRRYYAKIDFPKKTIEMGNRLLAKRKNLVVFCSLISEAKTVQKGIPGSYVVSNDTPDDERDRILSQFKRGLIKCVINVGIISIGFDFPELEACLLAFSTMSLARYYQSIGRVMRPHINKIKAWIIDLGGNMQRFGPIETMEIRQDKGLFFIYNPGYGQLTNIPFYK